MDYHQTAHVSKLTPLVYRWPEQWHQTCLSLTQYAIYRKPLETVGAKWGSREVRRHERHHTRLRRCHPNAWYSRWWHRRRIRLTHADLVATENVRVHTVLYATERYSRTTLLNFLRSTSNSAITRFSMTRLTAVHAIYRQTTRTCFENYARTSRNLNDSGSIWQRRGNDDIDRTLWKMYAKLPQMIYLSHTRQMSIIPSREVLQRKNNGFSFDSSLFLRTRIVHMCKMSFITKIGYHLKDVS